MGGSRGGPSESTFYSCQVPRLRLKLATTKPCTRTPSAFVCRLLDLNGFKKRVRKRRGKCFRPKKENYQHPSIKIAAQVGKRLKEGGGRRVKKHGELSPKKKLPRFQIELDLGLRTLARARPQREDCTTQAEKARRLMEQARLRKRKSVKLSSHGDDRRIKGGKKENREEKGQTPTIEG